MWPGLGRHLPASHTNRGAVAIEYDLALSSSPLLLLSSPSHFLPSRLCLVHWMLQATELTSPWSFRRSLPLFLFSLLHFCGFCPCARIVLLPISIFCAREKQQNSNKRTRPDPQPLLQPHKITLSVFGLPPSLSLFSSPHPSLSLHHIVSLSLTSRLTSWASSSCLALPLRSHPVRLSISHPRLSSFSPTSSVFLEAAYSPA